MTVADRDALGIPCRRIDEPPRSAGRQRSMRVRLRLSLNRRRFHMHSIAAGIVLVERVGNNVQLLHSILLSVDHKVEAHVKEVLMVGRVEQRCDQVAMGRLLSLVYRAELEYPRQLYHLKLNIGILVEIPEKAILTISTVVLEETTSLCERRAPGAAGRRRSVCFHRIPKSSSWAQITF